MDAQNGSLPASKAKSFGGSLAETYSKAEPFPHIVIDDFMPPSILDLCLQNFPELDSDGAHTYHRSQEKLKTQYQPDYLSAELRSLFYIFNSLPFISIIENITSIRGLIPDPYFLGAGFHSIQTGGYLNVHADFNHHKPLNLERRINVLIYLNHDWKSDYGGQLELWDSKLERCRVSVVPTFNRCVIFNTTSSSFHGNPNPVNHPSGLSRKSIALYYYTSTWDISKRDHSTQFRDDGGRGRARAASKNLLIREAYQDFTPPIVQRVIKRLKGGWGKPA
jgi:hypothetical protein